MGCDSDGAPRTVDLIQTGDDSMRFRGFPLLGALLLSGLLTTTAFAAAPPGKVTIESNGCSFRVLIDLEQAYDLVGWKVKEYNADNWNEGLTLFKGSGPTDPNGD